jgi:hypothetical protein
MPSTTESFDEGPESLEDVSAESEEMSDVTDDALGDEVTGTAPSRGSRLGFVLALLFFIGAVALAVAVFVANTTDADSTSGGETTGTIGMNMAGPVVDVNVTEEALDSEPDDPDLSTPEAAVRSYLDWTSYAYRTAQSVVAVPTMTSYQEVHVDSYIQYNLQKGRLLDQRLTSVSFGDIVSQDGTATVPVKETWEYSYVSVSEAGKVIGGPYEISYDAVYTVVKNEAGDWVVDAVEATPLGEVQ